MTSSQLDSLPVYHHLKDMIISNATFLYGFTHSSRPRHYKLITSQTTRTRTEYRVSLVVYDEAFHNADKIDCDHKILLRSAPKFELLYAAEDLLKKLQAQVWDLEEKEGEVKAAKKAGSGTTAGKNTSGGGEVSSGGGTTGPGGKSKLPGGNSS